MGPYSPRAMVQLLQQETSSTTPSDTQLTSGGGAGAGGALHTSHISIPSVSSAISNWSAKEDLLNAITITKAADVAVVAEEGEVTHTNT